MGYLLLRKTLPWLWEIPPGMVCPEQVSLILGLKNIKIAVVNTETSSCRSETTAEKRAARTSHMAKARKDGNRILREPGR